MFQWIHVVLFKFVFVLNCYRCITKQIRFKIKFSFMWSSCYNDTLRSINCHVSPVNWLINSTGASIVMYHLPIGLLNQQVHELSCITCQLAYLLKRCMNCHVSPANWLINSTGASIVMYHPPIGLLTQPVHQFWHNLNEPRSKCLSA